MSSQNIGMVAGVFDPIHLGHTSFIKRSIEKNDLGKVYVLVEREPKYKKCIASYKDRKKMVELAIDDISGAEIYESKNEFFPITSSLPDIKKANPEAKLYLLLGDDVAAHIDKWNAADGLKSVNLIIAKRNSNLPYSEASSLKIRRKINRGEPVELDPEVASYIKANNLY